MNAYIKIYVHVIDSGYAWVLVANNSIHCAAHKRINTYGEVVTPTVLFNMHRSYIDVAIKQGGFYFNDQYVRLQKEGIGENYFCDWNTQSYKLSM